ncbi:hypothetical protein AB433_13320 [Croceicoccus naphthovorans]|uniref:AB hydrolase-1 domain-containing protein n=1 Tax=Croceicoccus naphthovorans TaxID=1348774 RepID=A0A0G3XKR8_9SPHN|nr:hypothetical protein AB433_13320 [Croceicoccus naphthovorans]
MSLLFLHGWAFDGSIWDDVISRLGRFRCLVDDRGYFGAPVSALTDGPVLLVTHSFGTMRALGALPAQCRGLVAINGFDCFGARTDFPGVPPRLIDRMLGRLAGDAEAVVADFRARCGAPPAQGEINREPLEHDLIAMRDGDARQAGGSLPILSIQGGADPIMPPAMRAAVFAGAAQVERIERTDGGHLLPVTDPDYCAVMIERFADNLA